MSRIIPVKTAGGIELIDLTKITMIHFMGEDDISILVGDAIWPSALILDVVEQFFSCAGPGYAGESNGPPESR